MSTSEFRRIKQKFVLLLIFFFILVIWGKPIPGAVILILMFISLAEIFKKKEFLFSIITQKFAVLFFEYMAKLVISVLYIGIIVPLGWFSRNRIKRELAPREIQGSDGRLEGCVCTIVFERDY